MTCAPASYFSPGAAFLLAAWVAALPCAAQEQLTLRPQKGAHDPQACIAAHQFAPLSEDIAGTQTDAYGTTRVALGAYERISPDGRFVLRSFSGSQLGEVSLIELGVDGQVLRALPTPLKNEAFPVQGSWRYLVDVNGDHYTLESIVRGAVQTGSANRPHNTARPVFRGGMNGFYAAAAELASDKMDHIRIRSLSWPNASGEGQTQGEGALVSRTIEVDVRNHRISADSGPVFHCRERLAQDGPLYALPMISVDGQEFAALPQTPTQGQQTMRIFSFGADGKRCDLQQAFDFSSGKAIFGFPQSDAPNVPRTLQASAPLAWEYRGQVFWYSRSLQRAFNLAPYELEGRRTGANFDLTASAFPGITRDGRVIYGATLKDCQGGRCRERAGYIISDPYQSNAYREFMQTYKGSARRHCITIGEVLRERARTEVRQGSH